jgi:hypothetical protein
MEGKVAAAAVAAAVAAMAMDGSQLCYVTFGSTSRFPVLHHRFLCWLI